MAAGQPGMGQAPASPQQVPSNAAIPQFYATDYGAYTEEAKNIKTGEGGDFHDKWPGSTDGTATNYLLRIGPPLTADRRFARHVLKFFIPKNFNDDASEKDVFIWPEGSEQVLGVPCPFVDAVSQLKQRGVSESLLEDFDPVECFYGQGWFRDPENGVNVERTKPKWINFKKSMYNKIVSIIANQGQIYGDLFDPYSGWDLLITRSGTGKFGTSYDANAVPCKWCGTKGPLHPDQNVMQEMLSQMKPLDEQFPVPDANKLAEMQQAAQRLIDHFTSFSHNTFANSGVQVPGVSPGAPPTFPQQQAPPGVAPGPAAGQPAQPPQAGAQPSMPPANQGQPAMPPTGQGQPGMPPQAGAPPQGVPPQPGMAQQAANMGGGVPPQPGQPSFPEGAAGDSADQQVPPEQNVGGDDAPQDIQRHTLESAQQLATVWGLRPEWVSSVSDEGFFCTMQIPEGQFKHSGEWYYSLIEDVKKRGDGKGYPKAYKSDSLRGMKRHINTLLKKRGKTPVDWSGGGDEAPAPPPEPVGEPSLPAPGDAATAPQEQQAVPPAEPPPVAAEPPPFEGGTATESPPAAVPQEAQSPPPAVQTEQTGGQPPACYFDPNRSTETGYYVISGPNPMTCSTCPWEDPCQAAADQFASQNAATQG